MNFFTSDWHLFHKNIVDFTERKLVTTAEHHNAWIYSVVAKQVKPGDVVYCLGDTSFASAKVTNPFLESFFGLGIALVHVKGNHDRWLPDHTPIMRTVDLKDTKAVLCHYPFASWYKQNQGYIHLHGHTHANYQGPGRVLDVGLDSAYKLLGEHRMFTEDDIMTLVGSKEIYTPDGRQNRE